MVEGQTRPSRSRLCPSAGSGTSFQAPSLHGARMCMHTSAPVKTAPITRIAKASLQGTDRDKQVWISVPYETHRWFSG